MRFFLDCVQVWIGIIVSLFVASVVFWLIEKIEARITLKKIADNKKLNNHLWFFFRSLTNGEKQ